MKRQEKQVKGEDTIIPLEKRHVYATIVSHDGRAITIDGHRRVLLSGSIHYPRSTPEMWPDLIKKGKEGGLDAIETYVFWNAHEPTRRQYDFSGKLDLIRFLKTIQDEGLYGVLRIGPYACAEWNYGGFPVWLHNMPGMVFRTTNKAFMDEMQNFTTMIVDMVKKENLFASQGGPIILAQIENEYGNVMGPYGESGKSYIKWCANMAQSLNVGVPWIMCQQNDAPQPMLNTCNGFYCDDFVPNNPNTPKMWTENWTGWFKQWGGKNSHRTTEDVAFSVARFFQRGGTFNNYYMYHGGTNFDRTAGGPYITTSYDYDAPLDEYGNLNQPKYGHLKQLHDVLHSMEKILTYGNISTIDFGNSASATIYRTKEGSSCFFGNGNENSDATISFQGESYVVPAWSVTILPDCKNEAYNTAKITTQTSMMVKKPNEAEDTPSTLKWSWRPENMDNFLLKGKGESTQTQLFDQKVVTNDQSDYLWYMTTVKFKKRDPFLGKNMSLRVNSTAHVLHAFVNGKHIGNQHVENGKFNYVFEKDVKFKSGRNVIALLSITVGLANYGAFFESKPAGITGPISITGRNVDETIVKDLSAHKWSYKTGLNGFENQLFRTESVSKWSVESVPFNRTMTWYKATFKAPLGNDPVVVDLLGLGKGTAWVNGNNIGRYWPAFISSENGCAAKCNYRGPYHAEKCLTNCGEPTQRWYVFHILLSYIIKYFNVKPKKFLLRFFFFVLFLNRYHVPRSFLNAEGDNTLVLFEEMGGNPSLVSFQTTRVGSVCANVYEKNSIELSCDRKPISAIKFASFGNPYGNCGSFEKGTCESSNNTIDILTQECVGKEKCSIDVSTEKFGAPDCTGSVRRLAVEAIC
ncbi:beta-galactosidase 15-like [Brassica napus]|uniref:beta-galactosidase 15-like n=1 Tax=Brassica napus TaxID=3708 RepID=UPI002078B9E7|nr:beta-galactosidase 15-like [Brassica napus]